PTCKAVPGGLHLHFISTFTKSQILMFIARLPPPISTLIASLNLPISTYHAELPTYGKINSV
ncbi:hypothetical protein IKE83_01945, partial [Candidatus Saccharibacteria bacterium]|nr:hypothetical protein [Candidatus Saccharibacteria bacterium]